MQKKGGREGKNEGERVIRNESDMFGGGGKEKREE